MDITHIGNVSDLVNRVAASDARATFIDSKTGARIRINIDGLDGATEQDEPFYIESPDGENLYDAYNRKEARMILSNIRKGRKYPDQPDDSRKRTKAEISRSPGQPVTAGGVPYIVGGGYSGSTKELDATVQKAAEALVKAFGIPVQIRFNSDRMSGGAWLKDDVEGFWAYGKIGLSAGLKPKQPRGMSREDFLIHSSMEFIESQPKELYIETNVKRSCLRDPSMATEGPAGSRYCLVEHKSISAAIVWLGTFADISCLGVKPSRSRAATGAYNVRKAGSRKSGGSAAGLGRVR